MLDIIKREIKCTRTDTEEFKDIQFSHNSYGHLCIRLFNRADNKKTKIKDLLIVFTQEQTKSLERFMQEQREGR